MMPVTYISGNIGHSQHCHLTMLPFCSCGISARAFMSKNFMAKRKSISVMSMTLPHSCS